MPKTDPPASNVDQPSKGDDQTLSGTGEEVVGGGEVIGGGGGVLPRPRRWWATKPVRYVATATGAIFLIVLIAFARWHPQMDNDAGCMYWSVDHYEQTNCDRPVAGAVVVPLDKTKMAELKKVTDLSVITQSTFAAYWYSKINGQVEFFTAGGMHPVDTSRVLKPVTRYMFEKYVEKKPASPQTN